MNIWTKVGAVLLVVACFAGTWLWGDQHGVAKCTEAGNVKYDQLAQSVNAAKIEAAQLAADKQKSLDAEKMRAKDEQNAAQIQAIISAQAKAAAAEETNARLTADIKRLQANDAQTKDAFSRCLPAAVLASLHGPNYQTPTGRCR